MCGNMRDLDVLVVTVVFLTGHSFFLFPHTVCFCSGIMGEEIQAVEHIMHSLSSLPPCPDAVMQKLFPLVHLHVSERVAD